MAFEVGTPYVGLPRKPSRPWGPVRADIVATPDRLARLTARRRGNATELSRRTEGAVVSEPSRLARLAARRHANAPTDLSARSKGGSQ